MGEKGERFGRSKPRGKKRGWREGRENRWETSSDLSQAVHSVYYQESIDHSDGEQGGTLIRQTVG